MKKNNNKYSKIIYNPVIQAGVLSIVLNLIIESLGRQGFLAGIQFLTDKPLVFLFNSIIIFASLSIGIIFRHHLFTFIIVSALWLTVGIINGVILSNRMTPFTVKDLSVLEDGLSIVTNYLSKGEILLSIFGAIVVVALIILLYIFIPKEKGRVNYKKNIIVFLIIIIGTTGIFNLSIKLRVVDTYFGNLNYAYRDNGVAYCFLSTWLNTGIRMPKGYSQSIIESIYAGEREESKIENVNIIMLQLESFVDPKIFSNLSFSEEPAPYFTKLKENYSAGLLTVPSVGAGTANTEFETITGMSVKFFGPGEYPYKSILKEKTCETIPYNLKELGYTTHAIHNHRAVFYGRNKVFANLGFDTFTSLEYMIGPTKTPKNWAKDGVLTYEIMSALESSEGLDYIHTISVQGHGKYPEEQVILDPRITVSGPISNELKWQYEYYVNQIYEMDLFIKELTETLKKYDEKVVLVMYGDHLPALEIDEQQLTTNNLYQTEYVIWSNFWMKKMDKDLTAYQLGAEVLDRINIHEGNITSFHQSNINTTNYKKNLQLLEYDILYGKEYLFNGVSPFKPTDLKMGVRTIVINDIVEVMGKYYLKGENFTEYSNVTLDGKVLKTIYLSPSLLGLLEKVEVSDIERMKVSQVEKNNKEILSTTE